MSRDYKKKSDGAGGGARPMGVGIVIGILLGLCIALGVALYINKASNPFLDKFEPAPSPPAASAAKKSAANENTAQQKSNDMKLEFDFYKILPGWEEAVTDREFKRQTVRSSKEVYFLQVAAFPKAADADNLKARLALSGIESKIQTAQLPDGGIWHRVRVGPFSDENELTDSREALKRINLEANLIKVREPKQ
jgi:cell division protein FtsN